MERKTYSNVSSLLKNGDLLFCSGDSRLSGIIKDATQSDYSHVGLILKLEKTSQWLVLESVETKGVRCVTLEEGYLNNYCGLSKRYPGKVYIARHKLFPGDRACVNSVYQKAFSLLGDAYNEADIIDIANRIVRRDLGISNEGVLLPGNKFICSEYVYTCFQAANVLLPFNPEGFIAPADVAKDPHVDFLYELND